MSLNRKAMVLAVGAALAPCAYAQVTSPAGTNWEFYGKFYPEMTHSHGEGATDPSQPVSDRSTLVTPKAGNAVIPRWEMQTSNTYIGFRGDKQIAPGSKAIWQLEQSVNIDEGTVTDNSSGVSPSFANRNSFVGLTKAEWGTVRLGNMDTPFKNYGNVVGFLGVKAAERGAVFDRQSQRRPNHDEPETLSAGGVMGGQVGERAVVPRFDAGGPLRPLRGLEPV